MASERAAPVGPAPAVLMRRRLAAGGAAGIFLKAPCLDLLECCRIAGFDFGIIDLEHSGLSVDWSMRLARHASALGWPVLVRLPFPDPDIANRVLESGAAGIQLSGVESRKQVDQLIAACRYPPAGRRSVSLAHPAAAFNQLSVADYLAAQRQDGPVLAVQIESVRGLQERDSIIVPDLDYVFLGTTDMAVSLACDAPGLSLQESASMLREATRERGVRFASYVPGARETAGLDVDVVVIGSDVGLFAKAVRHEVAMIDGSFR